MLLKKSLLVIAISSALLSACSQPLTNNASTSVEQNDLTEELNDIIFGRILKDPKIKYQKNNQDYKFNQKIDGELHGSNISELSINFVTSLNPDAGNSSSFLMQSMGLDELFIVMPSSPSQLMIYTSEGKPINISSSMTQLQTT